ncbi:MAG: hydroxymethylglutaryl-CoA reductase, partial [Bacteroidetes bacterium]|nr:hydroxymethylglutaryl-CoA reductase [Bacteroidota bacterium]
MHLMNILNQFNANTSEKEVLITHFKTNLVTHNAVAEAIKELRRKE